MDIECPKGGRHRIEHSDMSLVFFCRKCAILIEDEDVLVLANAAMQLTAAEAGAAESCMGEEEYNLKASRALDAYAAARREA